MICIYIDSSNEKSVELAECINISASRSGVLSKILDYSVGESFASVAVFILPDSRSDLKVSSKYCLIGSKNIEEKAEDYKLRIGYAGFIGNLSEKSMEEICNRVLELVPKIPKYKQVYYNVQVNEVEICEYNTYQVLSSIPLCEDEESLVLHIELARSENYQAACNLAVFPQNSEEIVRYLMDLQGYSEISFAIEGDNDFAKGISLTEALKNHCDLTGLIRKPVLKLLSYYCVDIEHKAKLELLTSLKGKEEFKKNIEEKYLSVVEILDLFHIRIPIGDLVQVLDRVKPRIYTVCSSPSVHKSLQFALQVTKKGRFIGLASRFFENLMRTPVNTLQGYIKSSVFQLVEQTPLLMIATGCGVAPFRSFILEMQKSPHLYPNVILIFGFRTFHHFLYREDFEQALKPQPETDLKYLYKPENPSQAPCVIDKIFTAYSRAGEKVHIQEIISFHKELLWDTMKNGVIYICGGSAMGKSVCESLKILSIENSSESNWKTIQEKMKVEVWG